MAHARTIAVTLVGASGWVGRELVRAVAAAPDLRLVAAVSRSGAGQDAGTAAGAGPLGVTLVRTLDVVVGTSGLTADDYAEINQRFALEAARYVADVEVLDYASAGKPDVPSGTARELAERLSEVRQAPTSRPVADLVGPRETRGAEVGGTRVHSVRMPGFVLSCEAVFGAPDERLTIRHDAGPSPRPYVAGTLLAIRKAADVPGVRRGLDSVLDR